MEELRAQTGMIVHLGTMDEGEVVYLEKISSFSNIRMYSQIGKRAYMHATGLGKAMLSGLSEKEVESIVHRRLLQLQKRLVRGTQNCCKIYMSQNKEDTRLMMRKMRLGFDV